MNTWDQWKWTRLQGSKLKMKSSRLWRLRTRNLVANSQVSVAISVFNYVVNFELVANLATAWKFLVASQTILVAFATVSVAIRSPALNRQLCTNFAQVVTECSCKRWHHVVKIIFSSFSVLFGSSWGIWYNLCLKEDNNNNPLNLKVCSFVYGQTTSSKAKRHAKITQH